MVVGITIDNLPVNALCLGMPEGMSAAIDELNIDLTLKTASLSALAKPAG
jgi:hypothetical protein